jgi:hypothetical protein
VLREQGLDMSFERVVGSASFGQKRSASFGVKIER